MEKLKIEVFSKMTNAGIVRMPNRKFPGLVIQGDSLNTLFDLAESIYDGVKDMPDEELVDEANELCELLRSYLRHYENVLNEHGIKLPYVSRIE